MHESWIERQAVATVLRDVEGAGESPAFQQWTVVIDWAKDWADAHASPLSAAGPSTAWRADEALRRSYRVLADVPHAPSRSVGARMLRRLAGWF